MLRRKCMVIQHVERGAHSTHTLHILCKFIAFSFFNGMKAFKRQRFLPLMLLHIIIMIITTITYYYIRPNNNNNNNFLLCLGYGLSMEQLKFRRNKRLCLTSPHYIIHYFNS